MLEFAGKMSFNHKSSGLWDDLKLCPKGMAPLNSYEESPQNPSTNASVGGEKQFGITQEGACFFYDEANCVMPEFFVYSKRDLAEYLECCEYEYKHPSLEYCNKNFLPGMYSVKMEHVQSLNDFVKLNFYINVRINSNGANDAQYLMPCDNASRNAYYDMLKILISNSTQGNKSAYTRCSFFKFKNVETQKAYFFMKPEFIKEYTSVELGDILKSKFEGVDIDSDNISSIPSQFAFVFRRQLNDEKVKLDEVLACCDNLDEKQKKKAKDSIEKVIAVQETFWKKELEEARISIDQFVKNDTGSSFPNVKACNLQKILFGAPGTGKSKTLNDDAEKVFIRKSLSKDDRVELFKKSLFCASNYYTYIGKNFLDLHHFDVFAEESLENLKRELFELRRLKKKSDSDPLKTVLENQYSALNAYVKFFEIISSTPIERVTFHPNYSFAQFVGSYKPIQNGKEISYSYVPGPFTRTLVKAINNPKQKFLLIIEEINRANVAAVFGDVFQLLDRKNGVSEYPVAASEDIKRYLKDNGIADCNELKIPSNMYIWATMNSADQGVFPMDTAFKRRWEFEYIGVDDNQQMIENFEIPMQKNADGFHEWMKWNELRTKINDKLTDLGINEDKLLGPFFISLEKLQSVDNHNESEAENFVKAFKSKVLMYLFEDAVKMKAPSFFKCDKMRYSEICKKFDTDGIEVFNF